MANNELLPFEYSRADEMLSGTRATLEKKDSVSAPKYTVQFVHPSEDTVSAYLIHKESNAAVGVLHWNNKTGISTDFDVQGNHRKGGEGGARLLSEAWKYSKIMGIGGPSDSPMHTVDTWRVQHRFNPSGSQFSKHPFSKDAPSPVQFIPEYGTLVDPELKGYASSDERNLRGSSPRFKEMFSADIRSASDKTSRESVLDKLVSNNMKEERSYLSGVSPSKYAEPTSAPVEKETRDSCQECGGRGQHSIAATGVYDTNRDSQWVWNHLPDVNTTDRNITLEHPSAGERFGLGRVSIGDLERMYGTVEVEQHPHFPAWGVHSEGPTLVATYQCPHCLGTGRR